MADLQMKTIRYPGINNLYRFMQPDGTYPDLTAGNIISNDEYNEDTEPYLFRALPFKSKRLEEVLVGAAVNWNQLVQNGNFESESGWNKDAGNAISLIVSNNIGKITIINNSVGSSRPNINRSFSNMGAKPMATHKYLFSLDYKITSSASINGYLSILFGDAHTMQNPVTVNAWTHVSKIDVVTNASTYNVFDIYLSPLMTAFNVDDTIEYKNVLVIDLTATFGSTIADYVYSLEQATAGSGIAWLKSYGFFTKPYYEYDSGTLKSVNPTAHVTRGVNAWDEEWRNGYYDDGVFTPSLGYVANKNPIRVVPNTTYCLGSPQYGGYVSEYDASGAFIMRQGVAKNATFTVTSNTAFINFQMFGDYGGTYKGDICINISDPTINGQYYPYEEHTYDLGSVPLYGVFQLENNKLKAYGDVRHAVGGTDRKFMLVDLGTLNWTSFLSEGNAMWLSAPVDNLKPSSYNIMPNFMCAKYITGKSAGSQTAFDGINGDKSVATNTENKIFIKDSALYSSTPAEVKSALSGTYLVCELATPTTETTTPFEKIQSCFPYGTEEYLTTNGLPVGHDTKYFKDVISSIAGIPEPPSGNGTYELKLTVTNGVASYSWVAV